MAGRDSWFALSAPEASFGGGATPVTKLEVINFVLPPKPGLIPDPSLYTGRSRRALYQGGYYYRGNVTLRLNYEGNTELWRAVLRGYSSALVETGVRDHTVKEGSLEPSYEAQASVGNIPTGKVFKYVGVIFMNASLSLSPANGPEGMAQVNFDLWSKECTPDSTPTGTPAFPSPLPVLWRHALTIDDGTADAAASVRIKSITVTFDQPHDEEDFVIAPSTPNPDRPEPTDFLTVRYRITQTFKTKTLFEAAKNFTNGSPNFVFQDPTTIGTTSKREFQVRSEKAVLEEYTPPVEGYGKIVTTAVWQAYQDPTDVSSVVMRFRNTESALP